MDDGSLTPDPPDETSAEPESAFDSGSRRGSQIGRSAPDIELLEEEEDDAAAGGSAYSRRIAASKGSSLDEQLAEIAKQRDEAVEEAQRLQGEVATLRDAAAAQPDPKALISLTKERDALARRIQVLTDETKQLAAEARDKVRAR